MRYHDETGKPLVRSTLLSRQILVTNTLREQFGELRSLLANYRDDDAWHEAIWACIRTGRRADSIRFEEQWVPYIERQHPEWERPLATFTDTAPLTPARNIAPFGCFELQLHGYLLSIEQRRQLIENPALDVVGFLDIQHCRLGRDGITALVSSPHLKRLRRLSVGFDWIGPLGVKAIVDEPRLKTLRALSISQCKLTAEAIWHIIESTHMENLRELDIAFIPLDRRVLTALARSPAMEGLEKLNLQGCKLTDEMIAAFAKEPGISALKELELAFNSITDEGARALARSPYLANLERLHILHDATREHCDDDPSKTIAVCRDGLRALATSPHLKQELRATFLKYLDAAPATPHA